MQQYSFSTIGMVVNGVAITGWDEGDDVIDIARLAPLVQPRVGAGGAMMLSLSSNRSGRIKFKLLQTSSDNAMMMALANLQQAGPGRWAPLHILFQDLYRRDLAVGSKGAIELLPNLRRGSQGSSMEWSVIVEDLYMILGTNPG